MKDSSSEGGQTFLIPIEKELKDSYLRYAMSVIVSRALPDVRDGLKPVHRRILFSMHEMGLRAHLPFKKCGRVVGDVLGKFHPHGEQSIYDALARLAQNFSLRYPLVHGQGNFGSLDGDPPASMRYTEARLSRVAELFLRDIEKETVAFTANYDDSLNEPVVLPTAFPQLLANGSSGIAVGMTTNIPSHNLRELSDAICALVQNADLSYADLRQCIKGPDFPTGGIIHGVKGIHDAYRTGQGHLTLRAKIDLEEHHGKRFFVISEIPYQVKKSDLLQQIAQQVQNKVIEGIADIRDESDRKGNRAILFLKKSANAGIVLNQLYKNSDLQITFSFHSLALVKGYPRTLTLIEMIQAFIDHRRDMITRRTTFELKKAKEREHILLGLIRALEAIDEVIRIIRAALSPGEAKHGLIATFQFSDLQAQAILDMRLYRLSSMEVQHIHKQLDEVQLRIRELEELLADRGKIDAVLIEETQGVAKQFGDERCTEIVEKEVEFLDMEDLLQEQTVVITVSGTGYIKRVPLNKYRTQSRGGKGSSSSKKLLEHDYIAHLTVGSSHDYIVFFTSKGRAFWMKAYSISEASRDAKGAHISTLVPLQPDEKLASALMLSSFDEESFVLFATEQGRVKKLSSATLRHAKRRGTVAITLVEQDSLVDAFLMDDAFDLFLISRQGKGLRISSTSLRPMGRQARGVNGMRLRENDTMVAACAVRDDDEILLITEQGYGKRVRVKEFSAHGRSTGGQIAYKILESKTGGLFDVIRISGDDACMMITENGKTVRFRLDEVPVQKRNTTGVRVIDISSGDTLRAVSRTKS